MAEKVLDRSLIWVPIIKLYVTLVVDSHSGKSYFKSIIYKKPYLKNQKFKLVTSNLVLLSFLISHYFFIFGPLICLLITSSH